MGGERGVEGEWWYACGVCGGVVEVWWEVGRGEGEGRGVVVEGGWGEMWLASWCAGWVLHGAVFLEGVAGPRGYDAAQAHPSNGHRPPSLPGDCV